MSDDQLFDLLGLRDEDEKAKNSAHIAGSSNVIETSGHEVLEGTEGAAIPVDNEILGEHVIVHNEDHTCTSSMRIKTTTASQAWVADKATNILKTSPNMGAKELQKKLQDDHKLGLTGKRYFRST
ncbi:hypothetical protein E2562_014778 [Oryza meyeriana var. granulata]|uniref:Uncharacterized protein n=1 Tax=Oryza meyeriana var. granulata TaxID=110450 RepID=A0A6G1BL91_9ORYZ|nr:hypothetical protein E2562_014778 [Oryza meyeriana var. granulata]